MALFRTISAPEPLPPIVGDGVILRTPQMSDFPAWAELRDKSRDFLTPWEPTWPADDLTRPAFRRASAATPRTAQRPGLSFFLFRKEDGALLGGLRWPISGRRRQAAASALGRRAHARRGVMTAAVARASAGRIRPVAAAPVEAACMPTNTPPRPDPGEVRLPPRGLCPLLLASTAYGRSIALCPSEHGNENLSGATGCAARPWAATIACLIEAITRQDHRGPDLEQMRHGDAKTLFWHGRAAALLVALLRSMLGGAARSRRRRRRSRLYSAPRCANGARFGAHADRLRMPGITIRRAATYTISANPRKDRDETCATRSASARPPGNSGWSAAR